MKLFLLKIFSITVVGLLATGCGSNTSQSPTPITSVLFQETQCPFAEEQKIAFQSLEEVTTFLSQSKSLIKPSTTMQLGNTARSPAEKNNFQSQLTELATEFDFSESTLVLVARGNQPNPGYGISTVGDQAIINGDALELPLRYAQPEANRMYAQVIVSPCVLLKVDSVWQGNSIVIKP